MTFKKIGTYLQMYIDGREHRYLNSKLGFHLMTEAFRKSRGIDL